MDGHLEVEVEQSGETPVVRVVGEVDIATAPALRERLEQVLASATRVVVDLSEVTFLDSTGLSVLVGAWKQLSGEDSEGDLRLVVVRPTIQKVLEITGLDQVFSVFATLAEALAA
ncbi:MAG: STAS domain-containing protein [Acidimicrobiales bacterium]|jgi:anti-sigma B factor antagonist